MQAHILDGKEPRVVDAEPIHGEDFCDQCDDCLNCYGGDPCYRDGIPFSDHAWVVYEWNAEEFRRERLA